MVVSSGRRGALDRGQRCAPVFRIKDHSYRHGGQRWGRPNSKERIYLELPETFAIDSLCPEFHVYVFDILPSSPSAALAELHCARVCLRCTPSASTRTTAILRFALTCSSTIASRRS